MHQKFKVHVPENQTKKDGEYYEELARYFESGVAGSLDELRAFPKYVPVRAQGTASARPTTRRRKTGSAKRRNCLSVESVAAMLCHRSEFATVDRGCACATPAVPSGPAVVL